ncbi:hypothetical protein NDU88_002047 [Pleurodeles waltl]|uniref:Uncharacterized protein n=1 Tax=Pleurodeles waltl TaxID=8319 RepID=A0AAV7WK56_PLEWA|nr:hypothetical protein NDU88_002047 [Pleurodeles waltl]
MKNTGWREKIRDLGRNPAAIPRVQACAGGHKSVGGRLSSAGLGGSPCRSAEGERVVRPGLLRRPPTDLCPPAQAWTRGIAAGLRPRSRIGRCAAPGTGFGRGPTLKGGVRIGTSGGELAPCSGGGTWCLLAAELHTTRRRGAYRGCPVRGPLWVRPPGGRTIGAPVLEAQGPTDANDGTLYAQGGPRRALIVLCEAGQCGIALRHPPSTARVGGQVPLFPGAGPPWLTEPVPI